MQNINISKLSKYYGIHFFVAGLFILLCGIIVLIWGFDRSKLIQYVAFGVYFAVIMKMTFFGMKKIRRRDFNKQKL